MHEWGCGCGYVHSLIKYVIWREKGAGSRKDYKDIRLREVPGIMGKDSFGRS